MSTKKALRDDLDTKIVYEYFGGECFNEQDEIMVIVNPGDDSGAIIEDGDGDEQCIKASKLFVGPMTFEKIQEIRLNYN